MNINSQLPNQPNLKLTKRLRLINYEVVSVMLIVDANKMSPKMN